jgi:hypothetical protein
LFFKLDEAQVNAVSVQFVRQSHEASRRLWSKNMRCSRGAT